MEDGGGDTPVDIAAQRVFLAKVSQACGELVCPDALSSWISSDEKPFDVAKHEVELATFRTTLQALESAGRFDDRTQLLDALLEFADRIEKKVALEKEKATQKPGVSTPDSPNESHTFTVTRDTGSPSEVLKVLLEASALRPTHRRLVHLSHVHDTVANILADIRKAALEEEKAKNNGADDRPESAASRNLTKDYDWPYLCAVQWQEYPAT